MALPYPIPDPATGDWNAFALKRNLEYLDQKTITSVASNRIRSIELIRKATAENVNNSSTLQDDNELQAPIGVNEIIAFYAHLRFSGDPTADIKFAFSSAPGVLVWSPINAVQIDTADALSVVNELSGNGTALTLGTSASTRTLQVVGIAATGSTFGGTFKLQWAQASAVPANTTVGGSSYLLLYRL